MPDEEAPEIMPGQPCPMCLQKTLTLMEAEREVPYFGKVYLFSMGCSNPECNYHKADVECTEQHEPSKYTFEITKEEDMKVRIVKSSEAVIKVPHITTITPGPASNGYVTNIEGILNRIKKQIEVTRDNAEGNEDRKKAKNLLKKLMNIMWGRQPQKIIIEDPSGNSAIISDKAQKTKL
ncbi:MAG: ZPR1 zinc finger domain-containing protein [Nanoarchaeota archaeon]|nr:ZPR1 zinc finger domain-containing protein [Nanoarchaeota archaeon]MBU1005486.1 ZPR1 zinc finger domain-containing protein [Nanoarchaeota archaeon]MBU1946830.1 ZPR1 zinc finger domain-containing protein [Nanoarchaeota archaeon]